MKPLWLVEMTAAAEWELRMSFRGGSLTSGDVKVIKRWILSVEESGLEVVQLKPDWRDHELVGRWKGHRAMSFSYSGRIIYRVENERKIVTVVRVTSDHRYS